MDSLKRGKAIILSIFVEATQFKTPLAKGCLRSAWYAKTLLK